MQAKENRFRKEIQVIIGPRNSVVDKLLGLPVSELDEYLDHSPWVVFDPQNYDWRDWPELWTDKVHDFVSD